MSAPIFFGLLSFFIAFLVTFYLIPLLCIIAQRIHFVDNPDGILKQQKQPTPYFGGVAVYVGFVTALFFVFPFSSSLFFFLMGLSFLLLVGLIDDCITLTPRQKFLGQCIACCYFLRAGLYLDLVSFPLWLTIPISVFWVLSVVNAFNLIDVMDGLTATVALSAAGGFCFVAYTLRAYSILYILLGLMGALCAFLWYNKPTARIYLGDAGSLFIGGFLAVIPFWLAWGTHTTLGYLSPVIILAIPSLEIISLIIIRRIKGISFYQGSPDHFSSYMQRHGLKKYHILLIIFLLSLLLNGAACMIFMNYLSWILIALSALLFLFLWIYTVFFYTTQA